MIHTHFEIPVRFLKGDVRYGIGWKNLGFRESTGDRNFNSTNIWTIFKTSELDETTTYGIVWGMVLVVMNCVLFYPLLLLIKSDTESQFSCSVVSFLCSHSPETYFPYLSLSKKPSVLVSFDFICKEAHCA